MNQPSHVKAVNGDHVPPHDCRPGPDLSHCATCGNPLDVTVEFISAAQANKGVVAQVRRALAVERVNKAMDKIQAAQNLLQEARSELSSVQHGAPAWRRLGSLYERVHAEWYRTRKLLDNSRIRIDREPLPVEIDAFLERQ